MSISLFLLNLKLSHTALLGWSLFLGAYGVLVVLLYPSIDDAGHFVEQLRELPSQVRSAIGLTDGVIDEVFPEGRFSFYGALTTNYLVWLPVFVGIYAVIFGSGSIAREMEQGILGTLLCQPLRRYKLLFAKSIAFVWVLVLLGLISWGAVMAAVVIVDIETSVGNIALAHAIGFLLVLAIFSYSVLISSLFPQSRNALTIAALVTFASYMLNFMSPTFDSVSWFENGSIFHFYQPFDLLTDAEMNWAGIGVYSGIIVGSHITGLAVFLRRDIRV